MDTQTLTIPFGKYIGQPITTLLGDTGYLEWCKKQTFFKEKYPVIYNICVNQVISSNNQNQKTPEHNKLQNLFLERKFNLNFINFLFEIDKTFILLEKLYNKEEYKFCFGEQKFNSVDYGLQKADIKTEFEAEFNWDVKMIIQHNCNNINLDSKYKENNEYKNILYKLFEDIKLSNGKMAVSTYNDYDEKIEYLFARLNCRIYIEIKPLMGDDYPNVLRKMNTQRNLTKSTMNKKIKEEGFVPEGWRVWYILLIGEYSSQNTTKEQIKKIFRQSYITVVFINELSRINTEPEKKQDIIQPKLTYQELEEKIKKLEEEIHILKNTNQK